MGNALKKQQPAGRKDSNVSKPEFDIIYGAETNDRYIIQGALEDDPECINAQDPDTKMTALHWAGANRSLFTAELLFAQTAVKVDPWIRDKWDRLAIELAIGTGNQTLIDLIQRKMFPEEYEYDFDPHDPPEGIVPVLRAKPGLK